MGGQYRNKSPFVKRFFFLLMSISIGLREFVQYIFAIKIVPPIS